MSCTIQYEFDKKDSLKSTKNYLIANNAINKYNSIIDFTKYINLVGSLNKKGFEEYKFKDKLIYASDRGRVVYFNKNLFSEIDRINEVLKTTPKDVAITNFLNETRLSIDKFGDSNTNLFSNSDKPKETADFKYSDKSIIKQGVEEMFNENPELASIGTKEQYSQYLDQIFPQSVVKDIVYHGSKVDKNIIIKDGFKNSTELYDPEDENYYEIGELGVGYYFTKDINYAKSYGKNIISVIINANKLANTDIDDYLSSENLSKFNSAISKTSGSESTQFHVKFNNQIHILSSKKDIEGFKNYVQNEKQNEDFSVESETIQNNTQDLSQELNNTTDLNLTCFL